MSTDRKAVADPATIATVVRYVEAARDAAASTNDHECAAYLTDMAKSLRCMAGVTLDVLELTTAAARAVYVDDRRSTGGDQ